MSNKVEATFHGQRFVGPKNLLDKIRAGEITPAAIGDYDFTTDDSVWVDEPFFP